MKTTRHGDERMNQRGFSGPMIRLIRHFGIWDDRGRQCLGRRELYELIAQTDRLRALFVKMLDKGGASLVLDNNDRIITVYTQNSAAWQRRPRRRHQLLPDGAES